MKIRFLLFLLSLIGLAASAKTIRVSSAADIQAAAAKTKPGDVVIMENKNWINAAIVFKVNGTSESPVTLKAETPGKLILSGNSTLVVSGNNIIIKGLYFKSGTPNTSEVIHFTSNSSYCRLTDCAITDYNPADQKKDCKWVTLEGIHNRIDHCYFSEKKTAGPLLSVVMAKGPNYNEIDSNYFGHRPELGANGAEIIRIGFGQPTGNIKSFTTVEHNFFEECDGEKEIISSKSSNNIFRYNTFLKCRGTLSLRQGTNGLVESNYFFGGNVDHTGGIKISGRNHLIINNYFANLKGKNFMAPISLLNGDGKDSTEQSLHPNVKNITIENNTFINNDNTIVVGIAYENKNAAKAPQDIKLQNNIFYTSKNQFITQVTKADNLNVQGNTFFGAAPGLNLSNTDRVTDPKLEKTTDGLYKMNDNVHGGVNLQQKPIQKTVVGVSWDISKT